MWIVAKIKMRNLNSFKKDLEKKIGNSIKFYYPKVEYHKYYGDKVKRFEKLILENYIFCYHEKFNKSNIVNELKFSKGLEYFLDGYNQNQKNILKFIQYCKSFENKNGCLTQSFFKILITKKAKFVSGPFTNMVFEIIEKQKNKLKISINNIVMTISNNQNYLYRSV